MTYLPKVMLGTISFMLVTVSGLAQTTPEPAHRSPSAQESPTSKAKKAVPEKKPPTEEELRKQKALDLLKRSYSWNQQVAGEDRVGLLNGQIMVASRLDKELARTWAHELFDLGANGQVRSAKSAQVMAINALSTNDPEEALTLLAHVDPATLAPSDNEFPGANLITRMPRELFNALVWKNGKAAMPKIFATADSLGEKGRYPYAGVMSAAVATNDAVIINNTAQKLLTRFQQGLDPATVGFDFAEMMSQSEHSWPKELLKPAIEEAVAGVKKYSVNDQNKNFAITLQTAGGSSSTARGPVEMGLLKIAPLIKRADPELWTQLIKTYPNLSSVPAEVKDSRVVSTTMMIDTESSMDSPSPEELRYRAVAQMNQLSVDDPEKAFQAISALPDAASRVDAYSFAAKYWGDKDAVKSAQFAAAAEKASLKLDDIEAQFQSACARLYSDAANKDRSALAEEMDRAFELGDKLLRKTRDEGEETYDNLIRPLVEVVSQTMKIEPDMTVAHIELIYLPYQKAKLLQEAASVLAGPSEAVRATMPAKKTEQAETQ